MNSFSDEFYFIRVFINLWFSIWKAEVSLSWKSLYKSFPPKGTRTANMAKLIKHKAFPFIWNRSGSKGKLCRADIHINHWRTSSRLHFRGSGNKNRKHAESKIYILSKNSHIKNRNFYKIHLSEISFFTKFTFLKSHFS